MQTKICKKCKKEKDIKEFYLDKRSGYYWGKCKDCHALYARKWRKDNPKKYQAIMLRSFNKNGYKIPDIQRRYRLKHPDKIRERRLKGRYGITLDEYNEISNKQDFKCAICDEKKKLFVDHNHKSNEIRKLLCCECNLGLGAFKDNPQNLKRAMEYLEGFIIN